MSDLTPELRAGVSGKSLRAFQKGMTLLEKAHGTPVHSRINEQQAATGLSSVSSMRNLEKFNVSAAASVGYYSHTPYHDSNKFESFLKDQTMNEGNVHSTVLTDLSLRSKMHARLSFAPTAESSMTEDITMASTPFLMEDDPGIAATTNLFDEFTKYYQAHRHSRDQIFELLACYEQACSDQEDILRKLANKVTPGKNKFSKTLEVYNLLNQEKYTWRLLLSLYRDRLDPPNNMDDEDDVTFNIEKMAKNISEKKIIGLLYERDVVTRQSQMVIDWLEMNAAEQLKDYYEKVEFFSQSVCWENTLHALKQQQQGVATKDPGLVTQMDPDAPARQIKKIKDLDKEDETRLLKYLFTYIRAGRVEDAQRLCKKCGQSWRAAALEGWRLHHDPNMEKDGGRETEPIEGNPYRDVWKSVCWGMAESSDYNSFEKAIYATLSGNLKQLLPVCDSWTDCLWAYFKVMVDVRVEQEIRLCGDASRERQLQPLPAAFWGKTLTPETIFLELQAHPNEEVQRQSRERYSIIQKYIILDDIQGLVEEIHEWLKEERSRPSQHLLRFMVHLVLFFRDAGLRVRDEFCHNIVQAYVQDLINEKHTTLIATYTAALPSHLQVTCYAKFLEEIHEKSERQMCIELAQDAGLDVAEITKTVVETIRNRGESISSSDLMSSVQAIISEEDRQKISAIDWLVFDPSQRAEAMKQSNALIRTFLATKKHKAARQVFHKLPENSIDVVISNWKARAGDTPMPPSDNGAIKEYMHIKAYLDAHDNFNEWFELYHSNPCIKPTLAEGANFHERVRYEHELKTYEMDMGRWQHSLQEQSKSVANHIYNVLLFPGGWMIDPHKGNVEEEGRLHQMELLRHLCLPTLCFLLQSVLHSTRQQKEAIALADIIASEQFQLYKVFRKEELRKFLQQLRESALSLVDQNSDPLGFGSV